MVYYRKYRPQTISELDLETVRTRLTSILSAKELPHAFLFTGPKGLGKTSSARILAKAINCEDRSKIKDHRSKDKNPSSSIQDPISDYEPCNKCNACITITSGSNIDVLEIDAASNRGIDEIRDLREKIKYSPASLPKKVYIIDEVHMLTTDAFNALLKTLEEPPDHAIFILATTEAEKVPATIASRTFQIRFSKPTKAEILASLERIVKGEKIEIDSEVLDEVIRLSEGAFRDAAKILEELSIAAEGKNITVEILNKTYKSANIDAQINELLISLSKKDIKASLKVVEEMAEKGVDFKIATERLAQKIHSIIMFRAGIEEDNSDIVEFSTADFKKLLSDINESFGQIKFSVLPQIPLELVVIGWCLPEEQIKDDRLKMIDSEKQEEKPEKKTTESISQSPPAKEEEIKKADINNGDVKEVLSENLKPEIINQPSDDHGILFSPTSKPDGFLAVFLSRLKQDNHSIAGVLRGCKLIEIRPNEVVFETRFRFHRDKLMESKTASILDSRASELLAEKVRVVVNLVQE